MTYTGSPDQEITQVTGHPQGFTMACTSKCRHRHQIVKFLKDVAKDRREERENAARKSKITLISRDESGS